MLILALVLVLAGLAALATLVVITHKHYMQTHTYALYTPKAFAAMSVALGLLGAGAIWATVARETHADVWNGIVLGAMGCVIVMGMAWRQVRRLGWRDGLGGTALQVIFTPLGWGLLVAALVFWAVTRRSPFALYTFYVEALRR